MKTRTAKRIGLLACVASAATIGGLILAATVGVTRSYGADKPPVGYEPWVCPDLAGAIAITDGEIAGYESDNIKATGGRKGCTFLMPGSQVLYTKFAGSKPYRHTLVFFWRVLFKTDQMNDDDEPLIGYVSVSNRRNSELLSYSWKGV